jgi:hypothetical protein
LILSYSSPLIILSVNLLLILTYQEVLYKITVLLSTLIMVTSKVNNPSQKHRLAWVWEAETGGSRVWGQPGPHSETLHQKTLTQNFLLCIAYFRNSFGRTQTGPSQNISSLNTWLCPPKEGYSLIPSTCKYIALTDKRDFVNIIKLMILIWERLCWEGLM